MFPGCSFSPGKKLSIVTGGTSSKFLIDFIDGISESSFEVDISSESSLR